MARAKNSPAKPAPPAKVESSGVEIIHWLRTVKKSFAFGKWYFEMNDGMNYWTDEPAIRDQMPEPNKGMVRFKWFEVDGSRKILTIVEVRNIPGGGR